MQTDFNGNPLPPGPRSPEETLVSPSPLSFQCSAQTEKLIAALCKAQGEIDVAAKDSENPHFKANYADLAAVWRACRKPLSEAGVVILQFPIPASAANRVALITRVAHLDQWMQSGLEMPLQRVDAHAVGTGLTYLRRYMLSAVAGIAPDDPNLKDDDGNSAMGDNLPPPKAGPKPAAAAPQQAARPAQGAAAINPPKSPTDAQITRLWTIATECKWSTDEVKAFCQAKFGVNSSRGLSIPQYNDLCDTMQEITFARAMARSIAGNMSPQPKEDDVP